MGERNDNWNTAQDQGVKIGAWGVPGEGLWTGKTPALTTFSYGIYAPFWGSPPISGKGKAAQMCTAAAVEHHNGIFASPVLTSPRNER